MQSDFIDSCTRHWDDAEVLFTAGRWANADHLYGFSAESALKSLMLTFGMPFDSSRDMPSDSKDKKHIDALWLRYETYRGAGYPAGDYALPSINPFDDWNASQRYANQSHFNQIIAEKHKNGANLVKNILKQAQLDGVL